MSERYREFNTSLRALAILLFVGSAPTAWGADPHPLVAVVKARALESILMPATCERRRAPVLFDGGLQANASSPTDGLSLGFGRLLFQFSHQVGLVGCSDIRLVPELASVCPHGYEPGQVDGRGDLEGVGWDSLAEFCGDANTEEQKEFDPPVDLVLGEFAEYHFEPFDPEAEKLVVDGNRVEITRTEVGGKVASREINPSLKMAIPRHQQVFAEGFKHCFGTHQPTEPGAILDLEGGAWVTQEFFGKKAQIVCQKAGTTK
jgi:hypothetical protein